ncbi:MAG: hypothetical protein WA948_13390, partial [Pontixanthobacter sp.]
QARYIVTMDGVDPAEWTTFADACSDAGINAELIGHTGGETLSWKDGGDAVLFDISVEALREANESFFTDWMGG